jgi:lipoate-protein ligase A
MILWLDGGHGAIENMRRDARLLEEGVAGRVHAPVLRLFRFRPAGITLGNSQDPAAELDLPRLRERGIEWATRPTGGRAIWHDQEWTLLAPARAGGWASSPAAAYERTCLLLAGALRDLGVPVEVSGGTPRGVGSPRGADGAAPPCFASTARHELTLGGRKFAGIAQRAVRDTLLQQGSLLLGPSHLELANWMRLPEERRQGVRAALARSACDAGAHLAADAPLESLASALAAHLPGARRVPARRAWRCRETPRG